MNPQLVNFGLPTTGQFSAAVDILGRHEYLDSCTAWGRIIEVSKEQAEAAARQVGPDLR